MARGDAVQVLIGPPATGALVAAVLAGLGKKVIFAVSDEVQDPKILPAMPLSLFSMLSSEIAVLIRQNVRSIEWEQDTGNRCIVGDPSGAAVEVKSSNEWPLVREHPGFWQIVDAKRLRHGIEQISGVCNVVSKRQLQWSQLGRKVMVRPDQIRHKALLTQEITAAAPRTKGDDDTRSAFIIKTREGEVVDHSGTVWLIGDGARSNLCRTMRSHTRQRNIVKCLLRGPSWWYDITSDQ